MLLMDQAMGKNESKNKIVCNEEKVKQADTQKTLKQEGSLCVCLFNYLILSYNLIL